MAVAEFRQLDKESLEAYIKATPRLSSRLGDKLDDMRIQIVEDGFINLVYIVECSAGSMVIKQALPYVRCIGESWPISEVRAKFEAKTLQIYASLCPSHVPELYHFDHSLSLIAMQYLEPPHILLREGLIAGMEYPLLSENISEFFAQVFFHSSRLYKSTTDHKRAVAESFGNCEMASLMTQLSFSPFEDSKHISWTSPELDLDVKSILEDNIIKLQVAQLKSMFCERTQALIHADFHAGSIMVTQNSVKVIDPEFAFYGPMGYDIGVFLRNLIVSFFIQDGLATHRNDRKNYKIWLLSTLEETWNLFEQKFITLWDEHEDDSGEPELPQMCRSTELRKLLQRQYMEDVFQDALGFCATYMLRSVIHIFSVEDVESVKDRKKKADCERNILNFGKMLLKERNRFGSISEVVSSLHQYVHQL